MRNGSERTPQHEPGRGLGSARRALAVIVLALGLSLLLNAPGIHKSAYNQPDGWTRDVALAVTGPLADVSRALRLDRPRAAVKDVLGRSDDDGIDTEIEISAPAPAGRRPRRQGRQAWPAGGDAGAAPQEAAAAGLHADAEAPRLGCRRLARHHPRLRDPARRGLDPRDHRCRHGRRAVATGLSRPDVFNWFRHVGTEVRRLKPNVVVLAFGANDDKAYMTGSPPA